MGLASRNAATTNATYRKEMRTRRPSPDRTSKKRRILGSIGVRGSLLQLAHVLGLPHAPAPAVAHRRSTQGRKLYRFHDVCVLVPRDDGLQRHQAFDAVEVHLESRRRQPAVRAAW